MISKSAAHSQQRYSQEYRCVRHWIGRFLQANLIAAGQQRLLPCGLERPAACGWPIPATARLITQATPFKRPPLSSLGGPRITAPANLVRSRLYQ
jgi:hypothetical protein